MAAPLLSEKPRLHVELGERIKAARLQLLDEAAKSITVEKLASIAGVTSNHLSRISRGEVDPKPETLAAIAEALGVRAQWLRTGKGRKRLRAGESNVVSRAA